MHASGWALEMVCRYGTVINNEPVEDGGLYPSQAQVCAIQSKSSKRSEEDVHFLGQRLVRQFSRRWPIVSCISGYISLSVLQASPIYTVEGQESSAEARIGGRSCLLLILRTLRLGHLSKSRQYYY